MAIRVRGKDRFPRVQFHGELQAPSGFDSLVTVGISLNGPIAIWSSRDGEAELRARYEQPPGGASFPRTAPSTAPAAALAAYAGEEVVPTTVVQVRALPVAHPHVDVLADGLFLVVGARCSWTESGPELNALAIDQSGRIFRRGCLGDGIAHLQVAGDGAIWTGYFDEGVFGNLGGAVLAQHLWALVASRLGRPTSRRSGNLTPVRGSSPTATRSTSAPARYLLARTPAFPSLLITGAIQGGAFHESQRANLWAPDGAPLPMAKVHCRGSVAHFFAGGKWYSFDLESAA